MTNQDWTVIIVLIPVVGIAARIFIAIYKSIKEQKKEEIRELAKKYKRIPGEDVPIGKGFIDTEMRRHIDG